jgi:putative addiction module component (TIGR02574 family)
MRESRPGLKPAFQPPFRQHRKAPAIAMLPRGHRQAYVPGMNKFSAADALALPVPERLQVVEDIWNSIADVPYALELTDEDKRLIDERLEMRRRNPSAGSLWEEVCARITARRK